MIALVRELIDHLPAGGRRSSSASRTRCPTSAWAGCARAASCSTSTPNDLRFTLADTDRYFFSAAAAPAAVARRPSCSCTARPRAGWPRSGSPSLALRAARHRVATSSSASRARTARWPTTWPRTCSRSSRRRPRGFLLRTSILRRLDASLCHTLVPARGQRLACSSGSRPHNLFVTRRCRGEGDAWRYHSLFADFLRAQLPREQPDELDARLHLAASGWYEARQRPVPAIEHAIEGGDIPARRRAARAARRNLHRAGPHAAARALVLGALPETWLRRPPACCRVAGVWSGLLHARPVRSRWSACSTGGLEQDTHPVVRAQRGRAAAAAARHDGPPTARPSPPACPRSSACPRAARSSTSCCTTRWPTCSRSAATRGGSHRLLDGRARHLAHDGVHAARTPSRWKASSTCTRAGCGRRPRASAWPRARRRRCRTRTPTATHGRACCMRARSTSRASSTRPEHLLNVYQPLVRDVALPDHLILSHALRSRIAFDRGRHRHRPPGAHRTGVPGPPPAAAARDRLRARSSAAGCC